ncbi:MAG TPA: ribosome recycling factor [Smithellaceae bacterium]|nr:ribosome recycling factor [Smithellaceae bacterium]HQF84134.1 ribosome recycling factor [Smithellaceae bacterium]HQG80539.1 ribosome recycling factor [Smithellaceae bacterium]
MKEQIFSKFKEEIENMIASLEKSFNRVRTGRASVSLLDGIRAEYYGTPTPLSQLATLSVPESRLIVIAPWDASAIGAIEKAIQKSELGLMPANDGKVIRLPIPQLTEERRRELVKQVKKMAEEGKIKLRNERRNANEGLKDLKKNSKISEDEMHSSQEEVQKITDKYIEQVDKLLAAKEKEIMEI